MRSEDRSSRYTSNEWLIPIGKKANDVFSRLSRNDAIDAAYAILTQEDMMGIDSQIPWVVVFPSDDLDEVCSRLMVAFKTPDGQTPAYNVRLQPAISELHKILSDGRVGWDLRYDAAYHFVRVAAGKPEESFRGYKDLARRWRQYAGDWTSTLEKQFGEQNVIAAEERHPELFLLLRQNKLIAARDMKEHPPLQQLGESTKGFLERAFFSVSMTNNGVLDTEALEKATKLIERTLVHYREDAYRLRGLIYIQ